MNSASISNKKMNEQGAKFGRLNCKKEFLFVDESLFPNNAVEQYLYGTGKS